MAKEEQKTVSFDVYEEGAVIEALNRMRTDQLNKGESADFVSELMLKFLEAPTKKVRVRDEAR